ncbi:ATP synthase F0 subunit C [Mycoplasma sp. 128]|uniref:ATP synthase F0 subunit C n=1 Tax=Mycoplasma sp. 3341 TaxID=3447506 RepID=UPI003F65E2AA
MNTELVTNLFNISQIKDNGTASEAAGLAYGLALVGAGIAMVGAGGAGMGQGYLVGKTVEAIGRNPEARSKLTSLMLIGLSFVETSAIYCLVISFLLIFV